jgi:hypothetical protein
MGSRNPRKLWSWWGKSVGSVPYRLLQEKKRKVRKEMEREENGKSEKENTYRSRFRAPKLFLWRLEISAALRAQDGRKNEGRKKGREWWRRGIYRGW